MEPKKSLITKKMVLGALRYVAILLCAAVVVYEAAMIFLDRRANLIASNEYENLQNQYAILNQTDDSADNLSEDDSRYPSLELDYEALEEINGDFIGWIYFPALEISYPIVRENTIDEYLHKTFEGTSNNSGAIFMDLLSNAEFNGFSDFIFGHNMRNGSMFGRLNDLLKDGGAQLIDEEPYLYVYTEKKVIRYEIFAYYQSTAGSTAYDEVRDAEDYTRVVDFIRENNQYANAPQPDFALRPEILTLSTCSGPTGGNVRLLVSSVKKQEWPREE